MAELDVSGSFLITIGRGNGPETWLALSANSEAGKPVVLKFPKELGGDGPVEVFVALSAMFGAFPVPLHVVEVETQPLGFYGLRVVAPGDLGAKLEAMRPSTLGVIVTTKTDRGQGLACSCGGAEVTSWFAARTQKPGRSSRRGR
jgi:hypothetical protein